MSPFPLLIAQDLEAGKTADGPVWPDAMSVSAANSIEDTYQWAFLQGKQARSFGVNAAFGPVLDIALCDRAENTGYRTLGSDPCRVAEYGAAMIRGYQDAGILPFAKHYPGFGAAVGDPHMEMSRLHVDAECLKKRELLPYQKAIKEGLLGVMSGHVLVDQVDPFPATVSKKLIDILRNDLHFDGLLITDSLAMKGMLLYDHSPLLYERTLLAGHDLILANYHLPDKDCLDILEEAVCSGRLPLPLVEEKVRRVLREKFRLESFETLPWSEEENTAAFCRIAKNAPSYIQPDKNAFVPLDPNGRYLCLFFSDDPEVIEGEFNDLSSNTARISEALRSTFPSMQIRRLPLCPTSRQIEGALIEALDYGKILIVARTLCGCYTGFDGLSYQAQSIIRSLSDRIETLVIWGTPFACKPVLHYVPQVLFIYDSRYVVADQILGGKLAPTGILPIDLSVTSDPS